MRQLGTMASSTTLTLWGWALPLLLDTKVSLPVQAAPFSVAEGRQTPAPGRRHAAAAGLTLAPWRTSEVVAFPADECPCMLASL